MRFNYLVTGHSYDESEPFTSEKGIIEAPNAHAAMRAAVQKHGDTYDGKVTEHFRTFATRGAGMVVTADTMEPIVTHVLVEEVI